MEPGVKVEALYDRRKLVGFGGVGCLRFRELDAEIGNLNTG